MEAAQKQQLSGHLRLSASRENTLCLFSLSRRQPPRENTNDSGLAATSIAHRGSPFLPLLWPCELLLAIHVQWPSEGGSAKSGGGSASGTAAVSAAVWRSTTGLSPHNGRTNSGSETTISSSDSSDATTAASQKIHGEVVAHTNLQQHCMRTRCSLLFRDLRHLQQPRPGGYGLEDSGGCGCHGFYPPPFLSRYGSKARGKRKNKIELYTFTGISNSTRQHKWKPKF